jgi:hypothetical protein
VTFGPVQPLGSSCSMDKSHKQNLCKAKNIMTRIWTFTQGRDRDHHCNASTLSRDVTTENALITARAHMEHKQRKAERQEAHCLYR